MGSNLYDWFGMNQYLFILINKIHTPAFDQLMLIVTTLGHPQLYPFYIAIALLVMWFKPNLMPQRNVVTFSVSYIVTSIFFVPLLKSSLNFPRPFAILGEQNVTILGNPDVVHSFPSGHSAYVILMAASLIPGIPRLGKVALIMFTLLVCISRISVGAHFPADVVGSLILALAVVFSVRSIIGPVRMSPPMPTLNTRAIKSNANDETPGSRF
jgi:membrane-associated phospholipid phosphatase